MLPEFRVGQVRLNIHPVLLGSGIPTFPEIGKRVRLMLTESHQLDGGCILANYRVMA